MESPDRRECASFLFFILLDRAFVMEFPPNIQLSHGELSDGRLTDPGFSSNQPCTVVRRPVRWLRFFKAWRLKLLLPSTSVRRETACTHAEWEAASQLINLAFNSQKLLFRDILTYSKIQQTPWSTPEDVHGYKKVTSRRLHHGRKTASGCRQTLASRDLSLPSKIVNRDATQWYGNSC